jgi:CheY-like chemotaxis protein
MPFRVTLPIAAIRQELSPLQSTSSVAETAEALGLSFDLRGVLVLVVDDDEAARDLLTTALTQMGAVVRAAASAVEALVMLDEWQPNVLVSDIGMPVEDGYAFIRKVRERGPERGGDIPAVALTAYAKSEDRLRALSAGYQMHVAKPVDPIELAAVVANFAGRLGRDNR